MLKQTRKNLVIGLLLFVAMAWFSGLATFYSSADVEGRIVDAETGKPIEGAVVVGIWQLESMGLEHTYGDAIHVVESVSDAEGRYHLEGFALKWVGIPGGQLMDIDPNISVFAEGYRPGGSGRDPILERGKGFRRVSPLNGRDIRLKRATADDWNIARLWWGGVNSLVDNGGCELTRLPSFKELIARVEQRYVNANKSAQKTYMDASKKYLGAVGIYKGAVKRCSEGGGR